jgi:hypothetical protein
MHDGLALGAFFISLNVGFAHHPEQMKKGI